MVTTESRQLIMRILGESGCYFLSLVRLAEEITGKRIDAVVAYLEALEKRWIDPEVSLLNPAAFLSDLTSIRFTVKKESPDYKSRENEYEVLAYTSGLYLHFVLGDGAGGVQYDPLGDSRTVAYGKLSGKRIFCR